MRTPIQSQLRNTRRGSISALALFMLLAMTILGLSMYTLSSTSSRIAERAYEKVQATASAESGLHILYGQIAAALDSAVTVPATVSGTLRTTVGSSATTDGSYSASVGSSATAGTVTTYGVSSTGTAPNGLTLSAIAATFTSTAVAGSGFHFPNGAILSNGPVTIGNSQTGTIDNSSVNSASIYANGAVSIGNNSVVNGSVISASSVSNQGTVTGTVTTGITTPFPSAATLTAWTAAWKAAAQAGTQYAACPVSGTVLTAPAYINGSLTNNLTITPCSGTNSVVFVNGNISGNLYIASDGNANDSVTIVCTGTFTSQNLTGAYQPYDCTLVTLDTNNINLDNTSRSTIDAALYAANAGFNIKNGGWTFNGSVIAGGTYGVTFGNGSGNASIGYPGNNLDSNSNSFTFTPQLSRLGNWVQTQ